MNKKFVILSAISLFLGTKVIAQDEPVKDVADDHSLKRVEFGFRFMPTFSAFDMQTSSGGTIKGEVTLGYGIGALLAFNLSSHVGIQGEVIYNSLSQKYKDQEIERIINVRYINIPLLLSLNTGASKPVNLNIVLGPQIGINVGSSIKSSSGPVADTVTTVFVAKKSDFGFAYGAGLGFALNTDRTVRLDIGFRGVYGFVNVSDTKPITTDNAYYILDRATVRTYSAYLGFTFLF